METITTVEGLVDSLIQNKVTMVEKQEFKLVLDNFSKIDAIEGDIIECGVWRGGFSIFLAHIFEDRTIWVCDSFQGFQPLEEAKHQYAKERHTPVATHNSHGPIGISLEEVENYFRIYGLENQSRIRFVKGFVKDTLPKCNIGKVALLRIDVDAYSATLETLEELYDKVQSGGFIVFDDSCLIETLDAIRDFFRANKLPNYILDPKTGIQLNLDQRHMQSDSGFPAGCYFVKQ